MPEAKKRTIWLNYAADGGCNYHRMLCPARFCNPYMETRGWEILTGEGLPKGHDVYMFHGLPDMQLLLEVYRHKAAGKTFVWGVDDDWRTIPDWNPANAGEYGQVIYHQVKAAADFIVCSTDALAKTFADVSHKVMVAPNLIDFTRFPHIPLKETPQGLAYDIAPPVVPRFVWAGGPTHSKDTDEIVDAIDWFLDKYGQKGVNVTFFGPAPHPKLMRNHLHRGLIHQSMVNFPAYQKILNSIEPTVYLCPLAPVPFNESKSALRVLEAWALAACPIASDFGPYQLIEHEVDGLLASDTETWKLALARLVARPDARTAIACQGRGRAELEYNWRVPACRRPWVDAFETVCGLDRRAEPPLPLS